MKIDMDWCEARGIKPFSDGCGGPQTSDARLRKCARDVTFVEPIGESPLGIALYRMVFGWGGNLPGNMQTAPCAEMMVAV